MKPLFVMLLAFSVLPAAGQQQPGVRYISDPDLSSSRPVVKASLKSPTKPSVATTTRATIDPTWDEELAQARQAHRELCEENGYFRRHFSRKFKDQIELVSEPLQKRFASYHADRKLSRNEMHQLELDMQTELAALMPGNARLTNTDQKRMDVIRSRYDQQIKARSQLVYLSIERAEKVSSEMAELKPDCAAQTARR
jgi:hypothetical protein